MIPPGHKEELKSMKMVQRRTGNDPYPRNYTQKWQAIIGGFSRIYPELGLFGTERGVVPGKQEGFMMTAWRPASI